jgi:hypothetical protein
MTMSSSNTCNLQCMPCDVIYYWTIPEPAFTSCLQAMHCFCAAAATCKMASLGDRGCMPRSTACWLQRVPGVAVMLAKA